MEMIISRVCYWCNDRRSLGFIVSFIKFQFIFLIFAGLGSILFAITVDRPELNKGHTTPNSVHIQSSFDSVNEAQEPTEPEPVISENMSPGSSKCCACSTSINCSLQREH